MKKYNNLLYNILTDYDNKTFDTGRVIAFIYFIAGVVYEGWALWHGKPFGIQEYFVGGAAFLAGLGAYTLGDGKGRGGQKENDRSVPTE